MRCTRSPIILLLGGALASCSVRPPPVRPSPPARRTAPAAPALGRATAEPSPSVVEPPLEAEAVAPETPTSPCPSGMQRIRFDHCPKLARRCLDKEYDKPNHITICRRFATSKPICNSPRIALDFCIDQYEYPNELGGRPPVMLSFYEAKALCEAETKRLCYESEWVSACEGPDEKPFPYGYARSSERCNIDNRWVDPHLDRVYAKDPEVQRAELARLDRSLPSGAKSGCVSDFGVYDLTGNVDEWALADQERPHERSKFAALKGGAWGHVRNACRPVTTSHAPSFQYYFIGFRCCSDVGGLPQPAGRLARSTKRPAP